MDKKCEVCKYIKECTQVKNKFCNLYTIDNNNKTVIHLKENDYLQYLSKFAVRSNFKYSGAKSKVVI